MRFIHAADIHLDSPLHGLSAYQDAPVEMLRTATRDAFSALINLAIEESIDFMVIAGDLYDGTWRDHNTGIFFCKEMGRLERAGIPVFILFGNHDAESEMTKKLTLPANVRCFSARKPETFTLESLKVALHGQSFKQPEVIENLVTTYPAPVPGWFNVGVLHTALEGYAMHANYAPCSIDQLHTKGYQYWALGHVHEHAVWTGASTIVFPGNLQGRHIREQGPRGAVMVTVNDLDNVKVERVFVDVLRWHSVLVDTSGHDNLSGVVRAAGAALEALCASSPSSLPLAVRVTFTGKTKAHGELFGSAAQLRAELLAKISSIGNDRLWLEKVKVRTEPAVGSAEIAVRSDAIADLQGFLLEAQTDPEFLKSLKEDLLVLVNKAPHELREAVPDFDAIVRDDLARIVQQVSPALIAQLTEAE